MPSTRAVRDDFHKLYYQHAVTGGSWLGVPAWKCPLDLWVYQEILFERRPQLIIETGTAYGGSALFLGSICELIGGGQVFSIDITPPPVPLPQHPMVEFLTGSSTDPGIVALMREYSDAMQSTMVILDSDHSCEHVLAELEVYAPMVSVGQYLIVEDTNVNGHPVREDHGPGPWEAVGIFLERHQGQFAIDVARENFLLSFNPGGYLRRIA